mgnify:FL=1
MRVELQSMRPKWDIIFDVDGTLMDITHRVPYLRSKPEKDWVKFRELTSEDKPNLDIFEVAIAMQDRGHRIIISSGRNKSQMAVTLDQLYDNGLAMPVAQKAYYFRSDTDYRPDDVLKMEYLNKMRADGYNPTMAFDDRSTVVAMWRKAGLRCLQVAEGDF